METEKPGQLVENAGTSASEPPPQAATTGTTPPPSQTTPPQTDSGSQPEGTPDAAPTPDRDDKGRFLPADRAKAGEAGGWMVHLSPQDREELKNEPWRYSEMKAKAAAFDRLQTQQQPVQQAPPAPDAGEEYAKRMADLTKRADNLTPEDYYRQQAEIQKDFNRKIAVEAAREAAVEGYGKMTEKQELSFLRQQPEVADPDFTDKMVGLYTRANGAITRIQAFEQTKAWFAQMRGGNGYQKPTPPVVAPMGEMRSSAQPPSQPSVSWRDKFAQTPTGKAINERGRLMP